MTKILLIHAYSASNRGDGLLVDLAVDVALRSFGEESEILVLAIDAPSFDGRYCVLQYAPTGQGLGSKLLGIAVMVRAIWLGGDPLSPIAGADFGVPDIIIGVGGGYMRTDGGIKSFKAFLAHGLQLRWAIGTGIPTFYLSQSVGPLNGFLGRMMRRWCTKLGGLAVRDDRSLALMDGAAGLRRRPDMAIFSIADVLTIPTGRADYPKGPPRLIARDLDRPKFVRESYEAKIRALLALIPDLAPAVQSAGRGNDDPAFYRAMGWGDDAPLLRDLIDTVNCPQVVVSVRLHGALESIRAGIPTIHLSYERKGFGAYSDLGIEEFVHNSNDFDLDLVVAQVAQLRADPGPYWARISARQETLRNEYSSLIRDTVAAVAGR